MRLVCPNCDAQYDVPDDIIPDGGRDVECSNCGHTWFEAGPQSNLGATTVMRPSIRHNDEMDETVDDTDANLETPLPKIAAQEGEETEGTLPQRPKLDPNVADILREEAEYENRLREQETLEYQEEFPLDEPAETGAGNDRQSYNDLGFEDIDEAPQNRTNETRKDVFPDIEEINSTLRSEKSNKTPQPEKTPRVQKKRNRAGFRIGFSFVLIFALIALGFYVYADDLKTQFPNGKATIDTYVAWVDQQRQFIQTNVEGAVNWLKSQADTMSNGQASE